jgi:predicted Zn-dependent protease with MMP-like domain
MPDRSHRPSESQFEQIVAEALDDLPGDFAAKMQNVEVVVEQEPADSQLQELGVPGGHTLLGLYQGTPLTGRGWGYALVVPDRITIYRGPIDRLSSATGEPLPVVITHVVLHEIAHHFGIPDSRLRELGY